MPYSSGFDGAALTRLLNSDVSEFVRHTSTKRRIILILAADALRVSVDAICADGNVATDELQLISPFLRTVATFYTLFRPEYEQFTKCSDEKSPQFIRYYWNDEEPFGYCDKLRAWCGLSLCIAASKASADSYYLDRYERLIVDLATQFIALGGTGQREELVLSQIKRRVAAAR